MTNSNITISTVVATQSSSVLVSISSEKAEDKINQVINGGKQARNGELARFE